MLLNILVGDFRQNTMHLVHMDYLPDMIFYKCDLHIFYHLCNLRFRCIQFYDSLYVDFRGNQLHSCILVDGRQQNTWHVFHNSLHHIRQCTVSVNENNINIIFSSSVR